MKIRKLTLLIPIFAVMSILLIGVPAYANPPWYDGPGGADDKDLQTTPWSPFHRALATDGLIDVTGGDANGFIVFVCQSQEGFDYSVDVKSLPEGQYEIQALALVDEPEYDWSGGFPPAIVLITSDDAGAGPYHLGTVNIRGKGEAEAEGLISLPPGEYFWQIVVVDETGTVILSTIPSEDGIPGDHVGFTVFP